MDFSTHPLPDYVSKYVDGVASSLKIRYSLNGIVGKHRDIVYGSRYIDIDDYDVASNTDADGELPKDTPMAIQFNLEEFRRVRVSDARIRSDIYRFMYGSNNAGIDLGSGDFKKGLEGYINLGCYDGPDRILIDIQNHGFSEYSEQNRVKYSVTFKELDFNKNPQFELFIKERMEEDPSWIITAANSIMHIKDVEFLKNYDFIYTLPSPLEMEKQGLIVKEKGSNKYSFTNERMSHLFEYDHELYLDRPEGDLQGLGINMKKREIKLRKLKVTDKNFSNSANMDLSRHPIRISELERNSLLPPFRKKIDGFTCLIEKQGRKLYVKTPLSYEVYEAIEEEYCGPFEDFEFECELIVGGRLIIHTVWKLGSYTIPGFCIQLCKELVDKVNFTGWDYRIFSKDSFENVDECLTTPEHFDGLTIHLAEGVVTGGVAAKVIETLDLNQKRLEELVEYIEKNYSVHTIHDEIPPGQIWEASVYKYESDLVIKIIHVRYDKQKPNGFERCKMVIDNLMDVESHQLTDYMDIEVLSKYKIYKRNITNQMIN